VQRRRPESRLYEFDGGLVLSQPDEIVAFAWEDIEYVERALPPPGPHDGGPYAYSYRIRPRGGDFTTEIELPNGSNDQVAASIAAAALGRARELLAAGETVAFGRISVGPDGLTAGDRSLLWSEVGRVVRTSEFVRVYRRGRLQIWASAPIGDVPDARALVSLALERARTG